MMFPAAILAGGLATRLRPVTETIPKALIEVAGEPFVYHQLRLLRENGIRHAVICAGHLGEMVRECVGDGARFGVHVEYSFDGPVLLGTGGALKKAAPLLGDRFFVIYGDSYLPCDWPAVQQAFVRAGKAALMTVYRNGGQWDTSNVEYSDGRVLAYSKKALTPRMQHIDYGLGVFQKQVFDDLAEGRSIDLAAVYEDVLARGELAAYESPIRFYEIGSFAGIEEFRSYLAGKKGTL